MREEADLRAGRIPLISWNGKTLNLGIGLGQHDDLIKTRARAVKALGEKVMIRWMWEMDGRKKADRHPPPRPLRRRLAPHPRRVRGRGCHQRPVGVVPQRHRLPGGGRPQRSRLLPRRRVRRLDLRRRLQLGARPTGDQWRSFASIYTPFYEWGMARGKPLMVGEFGAQERNPGEKAQWLADAREALKTKFPGIKAVVYFDADKDYDWRVTSSPETLAAFRDMANDPWFTPDPRPFLDAASAAPMVPGIPVPILPLQFIPRAPPKPPETAPPNCKG